MSKNVSVIGKIGISLVSGSLIVGAGVASAAEFDVTAEVQNTLALNVIQPMSLGTLFINAAPDSGIGSLVLSPRGGIAPGVTTVPIKSLGGQSAARASVATDQPFKVTVPTATFLASGWSAAADVTSVADIVELRLGGAAGNPSVARLYLANFTVGDITGGAETGGPAAAGTVVNITPSFGVADVSFGIGAEIFTDDSAARDQYQNGTYEGTFAVTAEF